MILLLTFGGSGEIGLTTTKGVGVGANSIPLAGGFNGGVEYSNAQSICGLSGSGRQFEASGRALLGGGVNYGYDDNWHQPPSKPWSAGVTGQVGTPKAGASVSQNKTNVLWNWNYVDWFSNLFNLPIYLVRD